MDGNSSVSERRKKGEVGEEKVFLGRIVLQVSGQTLTAEGRIRLRAVEGTKCCGNNKAPPHPSGTLLQRIRNRMLATYTAEE